MQTKGGIIVNNNKVNNVEMGKDMENLLEGLKNAMGQGFKETLKKLNEEAKAELFNSVEESIQIAGEVVCRDYMEL